MARNTYQRSVLAGSALLSGADLRGKARHYSGSYARARYTALLRHIKAGGTLLCGGRGGVDRMPGVLRRLERAEPTLFLHNVYVTDDNAPWAVWEAGVPL